MNTDKFCVFHCSGQTYAIPALAVRYVTEAPVLFESPLTDQTVAGVCYQRNEFLAVVDFDAVSRRASSVDSDKKQLVAISSVHGTWGLLVDQVETLTTVEHTDNNETERRGFASVVIGAATYNGQFVRLLDPNRLFNLVEDRMRAVWATLASATIG